MPNCIVDYFEWKKAQKYWKFLVLKNCAKILVFLLPIMVIFQIGNGLIPAHKTPFFQPVICRFGTLGLFWIKKAQKCIDNFWILKIVLNFWYFFLPNMVIFQIGNGLISAHKSHFFSIHNLQIWHIRIYIYPWKSIDHLFLFLHSPLQFSIEF